MAAFTVLAAALAVAWIEVPSLRKRKRRKELWVFAFFLCVATGLNVLKALDVEIPNLFQPINAVYKPVSDLIEGMLK
ncbi:hypothetical protein OS242_16390 [Tumebacillus sp. DT12]|uniref:Uncharacterized protein n=1 Tax=Tumebacillus lacus TaxID=2995335 RepID=A0ABT3X3R2_9BACL|nr:hypothetical protein [Tumebacillus lacus]MCX7571529.1 hypothetical protein [Tumebacillus lacus]